MDIGFGLLGAAYLLFTTGDYTSMGFFWAGICLLAVVGVLTLGRFLLGLVVK